MLRHSLPFGFVFVALVSTCSTQFPVSRSSIHGNEANINLLKLAWALARAGVAVLVLDGTIEWQIPSDASIRHPHRMACAGQWLTLTAHLSNSTDHSHVVVGTLRGGPCQMGERPRFSASELAQLWTDWASRVPEHIQYADRRGSYTLCRVREGGCYI